MAEIDFWYEFASTYSYPAAMRIEAVATARGVAVNWRPFLLGPIFAENGWRDSPFNLYPLKGRYMWRDLERICEAMNLPLRRPEPFPQNSLAAARIALSLEGRLRAEFSRAVYAAEFGEGRPIADREVLSGLIAAIGADPNSTFAAAEASSNKDRLKSECALARSIGVPGAPAVVTGDGEVFWGNDRLEQAVDWAQARG